MPTLKSLTKSAMIGTPPGEESLLSSAALAGVGTLGGLRLSQIDGTSTPCPPETLPYMSEHAASFLRRMLGSEFQAVLPEFLRALGESGAIVLPELLPALLGLGKRDLRSLVLPVIGERGRWLAGSNPSWAYATPADSVPDWETASLDQRRLLLERLRPTDPDQARELLQSTWGQDSPEARAVLLTTLKTGLAQPDEDFLESCLADRRKEVREAALDLLAQLPDSKLSLRVFTKLSGCLQIKSKLLKKPSITFDLPDGLDEFNKQAGVNVVVLRKKLGQGANWLAFMLSLIPPTLWTHEWNISPIKAIEAAMAGEWGEAMLLGWSLAAARSGDPDWAAALAQITVDKSKSLYMMADNSLSDIVRHIPMDKIEALTQSSMNLKTSEISDKNPVLDVLIACEQPWSAALARIVIPSIQRQTGKYDWRLMDALRGFSLRVPPALADELIGTWAEEPSHGWDTYINQFNTALRFRHDMLEALKSTLTP